jgi:hypothetical protein
MPQLARCLVFEWGFGFFVGLAVLFVLGLSLLLFLAWYFGLRRPARGVDQMGYKDFLVRGPVVRWVFIVGVIVGAGYLLYWGYDKFRTSFAVSFDTASAPPVELETLRNKFQEDTQATITIRDRAKRFLVSGKFEGACVVDLFETICRHYDGQIVCNSSKFSRSLAIDMK